MSKARDLADAGHIDALSAGRATYGGTADVITITTGLSLAALTTGMEIRFRATAVNTGATTINVDGIGAVTALTITGAALPYGYIRTDVDTVARYNGASWVLNRQIQTGATANGTWTRFENGVQTCRINRLLSPINLTNAVTTWYYPALFINTDITVTTVPNGNSGQFAQHYLLNTGPTVSSVSLLQSNAANSYGYYIHATGFWY